MMMKDLESIFTQYIIIIEIIIRSFVLQFWYTYIEFSADKKNNSEELGKFFVVVIFSSIPETE